MIAAFPVVLEPGAGIVRTGPKSLFTTAAPFESRFWVAWDKMG